MRAFPPRLNSTSGFTAAACLLACCCFYISPELTLCVSTSPETFFHTDGANGRVCMCVFLFPLCCCVFAPNRSDSRESRKSSSSFAPSPTYRHNNLFFLSSLHLLICWMVRFLWWLFCLCFPHFQPFFLLLLFCSFESFFLLPHFQALPSLDFVLHCFSLEFIFYMQTIHEFAVSETTIKDTGRKRRRCRLFAIDSE